MAGACGNLVYGGHFFTALADIKVLAEALEGPVS
jgi:hypothetical protein